MAKCKVYTDGNGSDLILVEGFGRYVPFDQYQKVVDSGVQSAIEIIDLKANLGQSEQMVALLQEQLAESEAERNSLAAHRAEEAKLYVEDKAALAAQVEVLQHLVKEEAHNAYWDASDSNRADRMSDRFDESVREQFEKYWSGVKHNDAIAPAACLAQVKADAVESAVKFFHPARDIDAEALQSYAERIRQGVV